MKESEIPIRHSCPKKYGISKIRTIGIDEICNICNYRYGYPYKGPWWVRVLKVLMK
jgi:hypothetical protein